MKCNGKKFEAIGQAQEALVKSTENELDDMRQMVEEKITENIE